MPYFKEQFGNPSSIHKYGRQASLAVQNAKKRIASLINANYQEILITSGGTESNNTALRGIAHKKNGKHVITSSIEHDAILELCGQNKKEEPGEPNLVEDCFCLVNPADVEKEISHDTCLVTIMLANNEVGTIQPIEEIGKITREKNVLFHTDAVQAVGKIPTDVKNLKVDLLSMSSHKINGPKGVGALYIRSGVKVDPLLLGGGQEDGLRSGTENVASIVGFGKACELAKENMEINNEHFRKLGKKLISRVLEKVPLVTLNGHTEKRTPNNVHFTFLGVKGEDLIIKLDENGIAASTGSACSVRIQKESHVLKAMGLSHEQITGSLRLTIGISNDEKEIDETVNVLKKVVKELRAISPYKEKYGF